MGTPQQEGGAKREAEITTEESEGLMRTRNNEWISFHLELQGKRKYIPGLKTIYLERSKN